jgi:uncharacterized Ntn-hydrolase superfamily protein
MLRALPLVLLLACSAPISAPTATTPRPADAPLRPVATYSIVARDAATGQIGVAVQSHWFSVGSVVPWAEAGVGAVATQSFVNPALGPAGLQLMRGGMDAQQALAALVAGDDGRDVRQVGIVDAQGHAATYTGGKCIVAAGGVAGDSYACQANLMERDTVWPMMARAFESSAGKSFAERLLAALQAAESEGGDIRGRQSAALLVVSGTNTGRPWVDRLVDLRVEDDPAPLDQLARLLRLHEAYDHMNAGDEATEHKDLDGAAREYNAALALAPEVYEIAFWAGVSLANAGRVGEARPLIAKAFAAYPRLRGLLPRLPAAGLLPNDPMLMQALSGDGP